MIEDEKSFENYIPILKDGRISPQGTRIVFETFNPANQIILPIEAAEYLVYFNGKYTLKEIVADLYKRGRPVSFKMMIKTLINLKDGHFLSNADQLALNGSFLSQQAGLQGTRALITLPLIKRIYNDTTYPNLFYLIALALLSLSIYQFTQLRIIDAPTNFGFPFLPAWKTYLVLFFSSSFLLTFKNILNLTLLLTLTGRAYNLNVTFNGLAIYLNISSDSLFLITNKLYLILYHFCLSLSYLLSAELLKLVLPDITHFEWLNYLVALLILIDLNPFTKSEYTQCYRSLFQDEDLFRFTNIFKYRKEFNQSLKSNLGFNLNITHIFLLALPSLWTLTTLFIMSLIYTKNSQLIIAYFQTGDFSDKLMLSIMLVFLVAGATFTIYHFFYFVIGPFIKNSLAQIYKTFILNKNMNNEDFDKKEIQSLVEDLPLFSYFNKEMLSMLLDKSKLMSASKNIYIIEEGQRGDYIYVLIKGLISIEKKQSNGETEYISQTHPVSIFGEVAAIEDTIRTADAVTLSECKILCIPARLLRQSAEASEYIRDIQSFRTSIMVSQYFKSAPIFRSLSTQIKDLFINRGVLENFSPNQVVFRQGTKGESFYLVIRGSIHVQINNKVISVIRQGGFFGEISVLADIPRTATMVSEGYTLLLKISADTFWEILPQDLNLALLIESIGQQRIQEDIRHIQENDN